MSDGAGGGKVRVKVVNNGPISIRGDVELVDHFGHPIPLEEGRPSIHLCRCGQTNNAPFCDTTHRSCGFQSEVRGIDGDELTDQPAVETTEG